LSIFIKLQCLSFVFCFLINAYEIWCDVCKCILSIMVYFVCRAIAA
jgi:hypothetical protein